MIVILVMNLIRKQKSRVSQRLAQNYLVRDLVPLRETTYGLAKHHNSYPQVAGLYVGKFWFGAIDGRCVVKDVA